MSKYNKKTKAKATTSHEGGRVYVDSPKLEMINILLGSFLTDEFYRSGDNTEKKLVELISQLEPEFVAKAGIYARDRFNMRSVSHVVASELPKYSSGKEWAKYFYEKIIVRPDDITEIWSRYMASGNKSMPKAMQKGFKNALEKFDNYRLAKYKGMGSAYNLYDMINITHANSEAIDGFKAGDTKAETWETKLSEAGSDLEAKNQAWGSLIKENKLGYMALIRNLKNILDFAPEELDSVLKQLQNAEKIKHSRVLPFRIKTAYDAVADTHRGIEGRKLLKALSNAVDISVENMPCLDGSNLVVVDTSGSMSGRPINIASFMAGVISKKINADIILFDTEARYLEYNPTDSAISIGDSIKREANGGGTFMTAAFEVMEDRKYDRIFILSDMQIMDKSWADNTQEAFKNYKKRSGANPFIYSYDFNGYGSCVFPEKNSKVMKLAGFSEEIFELIKSIESDRGSMIRDIQEIKLEE